MKKPLPKTMPVLTAADICREEFTHGEKHCLVGWARVAVTGEASWAPPASQSAIQKIRKALQEAGQELEAVGAEWGVIQMNDQTKNRKALLARVWNRAIAKLGYVVDNPEAKNLQRKAKAAR
jgi:hypothetical protein